MFFPGSVGTKLFADLNTKWGDNRGIKWANSQGIRLKPYRGGSLEGNQCTKLLKPKKLEDLKSKVPDELKKFVYALQKFDLVRQSCFGQELTFNYKSTIEEFKKAYLSLGISITPKVHAIIGTKTGPLESHVIAFCDLKGKGLGYYSEQASESVHHDFGMTWARYKLQEDDPNYGANLLKSVLKYNALHI